MRKMTTKHGHEWLLPQTVGEFQNAGVNLDRVCEYAGQYLSTLMQVRSSHANAGRMTFSPDIATIRGFRRDQEEKTKEKAMKIAAKLTPEQREALLAELQKEVK